LLNSEKKRKENKTGKAMPLQGKKQLDFFLVRNKIRVLHVFLLGLMI
jgi:hypothetical protein